MIVQEEFNSLESGQKIKLHDGRIISVHHKCNCHDGKVVGPVEVGLNWPCDTTVVYGFFHDPTGRYKDMIVDKDGGADMYLNHPETVVLEKVTV